MADIIAECKDRIYDFSWLPTTIGDFTLVVDIAEDEVLGFRFFHYENPLGWRWEAVYDKEVNDFTVHVVMPLFSFVDINFVRNTWDEFEAVLRERGIDGITKRLVEPQQMFTYAYKQKGLVDWVYDSVLPESIGSFTRDIAPSNGICMINGSFIIAEYCKSQEPSGLLIFYNVLRDEFFVELRRHNYPEINHDFDAVTIPELEEKLTTQLERVLIDLENRL